MFAAKFSGAYILVVSSRALCRHICRIVTPKALLTLTSEHIKGSFSLVYLLLIPPNYSDKMGMSYRRYLSGERIYGCSTCKTHLATIHSMMSRVSSLSSCSHLLLHLTLLWTGFQRPTWPCISIR